MVLKLIFRVSMAIYLITLVFRIKGAYVVLVVNGLVLIPYYVVSISCMEKNNY